MADASDKELLQDYERTGSEPAFAELVRRHVNLVYSAALRHVGGATQAEEITQAVFIILASKAGSLRSHAIFEGWLYQTTRLTSLRFLRGERRRQFREQEAYVQSTLQQSAEDSVWTQLSPLLDEALSQLGEKDRDAVVLRYFKNKSVEEIAAALRTNDAAAQRRVLRATEKLRKFFAKRGVRSTATILAGAISAHSVHAAPAALAKSITFIAVTKGAAASGSTLTLIKGALKLMAWTKAKTAVLTSVAIACLVGSVIGFHIYNPSHSGPAAELQAALHADRPLSGIWGYPSEKVAFAILHFGTNRAEAFPVLERAINGKNTEARKQAVAALGLVGRPGRAEWNLGKASPEAAPLLWKILDGNDRDLRNLALNSLRNIGFQPQDFPALAALLVRSHGGKNLQTVIANASIGKIQNLLDQASNDQQLQRYIPEVIAETIRRNEEVAAPFISSVEDLLDDTNEDVRFGAACALVEYKGVDDPKISMELTAGLKSSPEHTRGSLGFERLKQLMTIETLQRIGPDAKSMLPVLNDYANSIDDSFMRELAFRAEGHIDGNLRTTIPEVDRALKNDPILKSTNTP